MFYTYILYSLKYKEFYVGYTEDLKRRFHEHITGQVKSTKNRNMILIFYEAFRYEEDARNRELYFKTTRGKRALKIMLKSTLDKLNSETGPVV